MDRTVRTFLGIWKTYGLHGPYTIGNVQYIDAGIQVGGPGRRAAWWYFLFLCVHSKSQYAS